MTLTYLPPGPNADDPQIVELENQAIGVECTDEDRGTWAEAMEDPAFVSDQQSFLELSADADAEVLGA
jgi:hypothetical protein